MKILCSFQVTAAVTLLFGRTHLQFCLCLRVSHHRLLYFFLFPFFFFLFFFFFFFLVFVSGEAKTFRVTAINDHRYRCRDNTRQEKKAQHTIGPMHMNLTSSISEMPMSTRRKMKRAEDTVRHERSKLLLHRREKSHGDEQRCYGAVNSSTMRRANSVPVNRPGRIVNARRSGSRDRELTVSEQTTRLAEEAKKTLFHGSFTSSHGAMFSVLPLHRHEGRVKSVTRRHTSDTHKTEMEVSSPKKEKGIYSTGVDVAAPSILKKEKGSPLLREHQGSPEASLFTTEHITTANKHPKSADASFTKDEDFGSCFKEHDILGADSVRMAIQRPETIGTASRELFSSPNIEKTQAEPAAHQDEKRIHMINAKETSLWKEENNVSPSLLPRVYANFKADEGIPVKTGAHCISFAEHVVVHDPDTYTEEEEEEEEVEISHGDAIINLLSFSLPAALTIGFTFAVTVVPLAFIGSYLGELYLSGASVGCFILSIFVLYPVIGLTFAMDTLCSHEYGRDQNSQELGILLQRGILINLLFLTPACFALYNVDSFLEQIYGVEIARVARDFLHYMPLFMLPEMIFIAFNKFLCNQMRPQMPMFALAAGFIITPFVQMKLTPMGVRYSMLGMCITAWFQLVVVIFMTIYVPQTRHTLGKLRIMEALQPSDVKGYLKLAIPSAVFVAAEASSFDLTVLLCVHFGEQSGAAWSGIMNALYIFAAFSGGLSAGACANIGRCVGCNEPKNARTYVVASIALVLLVSSIDSALLYIFFDFFMSLFGTKGQTLQLARETLILLPIFHMADAVQFTFQGIFSGLGKNHWGALILLSSLWGVGIPLAFFLGLHLQYGIFGVCLGMTIGLCIEAPAMVASGCMMDYQSVCDAFTFERISVSGEEEEDEEEEEEEEEEEKCLMDEDVFRRSGIPVNLSDFGPRLVTHIGRIRAPQRH
ncbi:hypothetical protein MOQ_004122 [Trypanosoma cruzi marinkellei]|uniref:Multidrug resistance protein, MATE family n=1 Tax=Trypanosoma cruzi marinkellei TaxID=85056 RepID=K2MY87_TRYCR|nr:hypothetical protein MOQ_004122 [Trypanosoma cruzi marinkellei]